MKSKWSLKKPLYLEKDDKRYKDHVNQLKVDGFSDAETWSLDSVIAEFVLPRLKRFKDIHAAHPADLTEDEWKEKLDEMIYAFDWVLKSDEMDDDYMKLSNEELKLNWKRHEKGMKLFSKHFTNLWW